MKEPSLSEAVLVNVDDHEAARYARTRVLQRAGFTVHEAGTATDALRVVREVAPDVVLLDVHLPDGNGIEVCREIKNREDGASVIVLQISASATSGPHATAALNIGADAYLTEPIDPDVLVATVRAFLRLRRAERGLLKANRELSWKNSELRLLNDALQRSNEDLEHFAYIASHDLQEPLRTISTHLQLLERNTASKFDERESEIFAFVVDGARRMSLLIRDVLAYARIGKDSPPHEATKLGEALLWALDNLSEGIKACDAVINTGELPVVMGDSLQLAQVFQNLIGNSIKYKSEAPLRIDVSAEQQESGAWVVHVRDNGMGIAQTHLQKIFLPFKRLHGFDIPGNGIGLALCRRIIEAHGGRIWAESKEGEGSTFSFTLRPASALVLA